MAILNYSENVLGAHNVTVPSSSEVSSDPCKSSPILVCFSQIFRSDPVLRSLSVLGHGRVSFFPRNSAVLF